MSVLTKLIPSFFSQKTSKKDKIKVKLLGCFRTGTNFMKTVLENNYDCQVVTNIGGWKHGYYSDINIQHYNYDYYIVMTKNPYSSLTSWHKYYCENGNNLVAEKEWSDFIRNRLIVFNKFNDFPFEYRYSHPIDYWNGKNWHYLSFTKEMDNAIFIRYEDLCKQPQETCLEIEKFLDIERKSPGNSLIIPEKKVKNMDDRAYKKLGNYTTSKVFDNNYYQKYEYMKSFSPDDLTFVDSQLDWELVRNMGYEDMLSHLRTHQND